MGRIDKTSKFYRDSLRQEKRNAQHNRELTELMRQGHSMEEALSMTSQQKGMNQLSKTSSNIPSLEPILELNDQRQTPHQYSAANIAGFLFGKRVSAIAPEGADAKRDFTRGLIAGLSRSLLDNFNSSESPAIQMNSGKELRAFKAKFSALNQAIEDKGHSNWFSRDLLRTKLNSLLKFTNKDFKQTTGMVKESGSIIYEKLLKFWEALSSNQRDENKVTIAAA